MMLMSLQRTDNIRNMHLACSSKKIYEDRKWLSLSDICTDNVLSLPFMKI